MVKNLVEKIQRVFSGTRAKDYVADICRHHRIQASPGFRSAAQFVGRMLKEFGIKKKILTYPADGKTYYWTCLAPEEWDAKEAKLTILEPEIRTLADYQEQKLSLIQRSAPVKELIAEVILLEDGENRKEYRGRNLKGKIVLTKGMVDRVYDLAVKEFGAIGIIFDGIRDLPKIRDRYDIPDALQYTSFWWRPQEKRCFGFVISPKEGERIRSMIKQGKMVKVKAMVKSRFYKGTIEVVSGLIPGKTNSEILLIGHLCHPEPSANDNASGSGCLLEIARTLNHLIQTKQLKRPKRSIRFLWVPEMTGTYSYLATNAKRIKRIIAAVNLDMVGQNQELCQSSFLIEEPPLSISSYSAELLERIREELIPEVSSYAGLGGYALLRYAITPFSGGSDHYILSDPSIGIPCPMLIQWPDLFYHTSLDTFDKVDPKSLQIVGTIAATYAYFLANASDREARWLSHELVSRFKIGVIKTVQNAISNSASRLLRDPALAGYCGIETPNTKKRLNLFLEQKCQALELIGELGDIGSIEDGLKLEMEELVENEINRMERVCEEREAKKRDDKWDKIGERIIPKRRYPGPVDLRSFTHKLSRKDQDKLYELRVKYKEFSALTALAQYWANGNRSLLEIVNLVELETGIRAPQLIVEYFRILKKLRLVSFR